MNPYLESYAVNYDNYLETEKLFLYSSLHGAYHFHSLHIYNIQENIEKGEYKSNGYRLSTHTGKNCP